MRRSLRNSGLLLAMLICLGVSAFASVTATINVTGGETQRFDQSWDIGPLMVTVNVSGISYMETIYYGQFSSPASVASQIAGVFSRDHVQDGLCASANGATITFKAKRSGAAFGMLAVSGPNSSFQLNGAGFALYNYITPSSSGSVSVSTVYMTVSVRPSAWSAFLRPRLQE